MCFVFYIAVCFVLRDRETKERLLYAYIQNGKNVAYPLALPVLCGVGHGGGCVVFNV